jgi:hypothetical protein
MLLVRISQEEEFNNEHGEGSYSGAHMAGLPLFFRRYTLKPRDSILKNSLTGMTSIPPSSTN